MAHFGVLWGIKSKRLWKNGEPYTHPGRQMCFCHFFPAITRDFRAYLTHLYFSCT